MALTNLTLAPIIPSSSSPCYFFFTRSSTHSEFSAFETLIKSNGFRFPTVRNRWQSGVIDTRGSVGIVDNAPVPPPSTNAIPSIDIPVSCYQLIDVSSQAEKDEIVKSVMNLKSTEVDDGYTSDVIISRQKMSLMDSCCMSLKANLVDVRKCGFGNGDNAFLGEKIRGSLNNNVWVNQVSTDNKKELKIKTGAVSILMSNNGRKGTTTHARRSERRRVDPKNVTSIVLGGGSGAHLFPLTKRAATPAVPIGGCYKLIDIPMSNCINSGIKKIFVLTQFNSASLNRHLARTYYGNGINFGEGFVEVLAATQTSGEAGMKWFQGTADAVRQFIWVFENSKNRNIENVVILCGDHLYRMDYMEFLQSHVDNNADITISCVPMDNSRASDYGLVKVDGSGRIVQFSEKPKGADLKAMQTDTTLLGLSPQEAARSPYIASMGIYVFKTEVLLKLLRWRCPTSNDFGSEIIPAAIMEHDVQAYIFKDYWEDIGTIKSFYQANLALTEEFPKFEFYDPKTPIYTSPRYLPPTKIDKCRIKDAIISHGCFLRECSVLHSIVGERSRLDAGVELQDTVMLGADYYQTESEIAYLQAKGKIPIGIGQNTKIRNCIIDKNAKIGKNVIIVNKDDVQEADKPDEGFYIRSGITIVLEKATIEDGTII